MARDRSARGRGMRQGPRIHADGRTVGHLRDPQRASSMRHARRSTARATCSSAMAGSPRSACPATCTRRARDLRRRQDARPRPDRRPRAQRRLGVTAVAHGVPRCRRESRRPALRRRHDRPRRGCPHARHLHHAGRISGAGRSSTPPSPPARCSRRPRPPGRHHARDTPLLGALVRGGAPDATGGDAGRGARRSRSSSQHPDVPRSPSTSSRSSRASAPT